MNRSKLISHIDYFCKKRMAIAERICTKKYTDDIINTRYWLAYCILSSGVKDFQAKHISEEIIKNVYGCKYTVHHKNIIERILFKQHSTGEKWRYRFPKTRSEWVHDSYSTLQRNENLLPYNTENSFIKIRDKIVHDFKGIGYKQASLLIRSLGISYYCCVIDTHIIDFLFLLGYLPKDFNKNNINRKRYIALEVIFKQIAEKIKIPVFILDIAVWDFTRLAKTENIL